MALFTVRLVHLVLGYGNVVNLDLSERSTALPFLIHLMYAIGLANLTAQSSSNGSPSSTVLL